jgi:hypothetical protein
MSEIHKRFFLTGNILFVADQDGFTLVATGEGVE